MFSWQLEMKEAMRIDCVREEGAGEDTWSQQGRSKKITDKTPKSGASRFIFFG